MARVEIASQAWGVLIDATGRPLAAQSATLRNLDGTNATIWTAVTGGTSNTSALSSDSLGGLGQSAATRYVEEGTYTLTIGSTTHRVEATGGGALSVNLGHYGLVNGGNIATALTAAQSDIGSNAATISVPAGAYTHSTSLVLTEGQRLEAQGGSTQRWRSTRNAVKISYTGTGAAVKVQPGIGENRESVEIAGIHFDGTGASGSVDGLFLDGSATPGNVYIEGVLIDRCAFTNFPRYQARLYGQVFDITFRHCAFNNAARAADNLVHCDVANATTSPSQLTFDDCFWALYTASKWCFYDGGATVSTARFTNGTVAPYVNATPGANGIAKLAGGLQVIGTHIEGLGTDKTQTGIRYAGVLGALLLPSYCGLLSIGVEIGDPNAKANKARGAVIGGTVGGNATDIKIYETGSRRGTVILGGGEHGDTPPVVSDVRLSNDGIKEVLNLTGSSTWPNAQIFSPPIQLDGFNGDGYLEMREQAVATPAPAANYARIVCEDNGAGKTRVGVRFSSGVVQWFATQP